MKTLKITFALLTVLLLTVSGVKSDTVSTKEEPTYKEYNNYDLLAHKKRKGKIVRQG